MQKARRAVISRIAPWVMAAAVLPFAGCTSLREYVDNGFKVGPNYGPPQASTAPQWIDEADVRVRNESAHPDQWWTVFGDPTLDQLIAIASEQNLSLGEAGFRVLEARAQLGIASGNLYPQSQAFGATYQRVAASQAAGTAPGFGSQFFDQWALGFNLSWELDFWGRFRRAVTAAEDRLNASCADYDDVLVTLQGDVATNYIQIRTLQRRIEYTQGNIELQERILEIAERRHREGATGPLDVHQALSNLAQSEAELPQLKRELRQASNRLCILLGMPPADLEMELGPGPIPTAPSSVAVGIPMELLRRRPDVRRAQFEAMAQGEEIGIAEADLYPAFVIDATLGYQATNLSNLFTSNALAGNVGPAIYWKILNYGRIRSNVQKQEARFRALLMAYQNTVLRANAEVEDGLAEFLRAQERAELLEVAVSNAQLAAELVARQYREGAVDFNRVSTIQQDLLELQDRQARTNGDVAQGLIRVYRALGGGWQTPAYAAEPATVVMPAEPEAAPLVPPEPE